MDIPFLKIACRPKLYDLMGWVPRRIPIYCSVEDWNHTCEWNFNIVWLFCVPEYPASATKYLKTGYKSISDHSIGLKVYNAIKPKIWECHYVLEHDENNPDAGAFAKTPKDLEAVL
jgi:hypothetical protein